MWTVATRRTDVVTIFWFTSVLMSNIDHFLASSGIPFFRARSILDLLITSVPPAACVSYETTNANVMLLATVVQNLTYVRSALRNVAVLSSVKTFSSVISRSRTGWAPRENLEEKKRTVRTISMRLLPMVELPLLPCRSYWGFQRKAIYLCHIIWVYGITHCVYGHTFLTIDNLCYSKLFMCCATYHLCSIKVLMATVSM